MSSSTSGSDLKRAARTLLWLAAFLFLFDRGLTWLLARSEAVFYRDPEYASQFREFMKDKSYSTLILGTSRTKEGIHPRYFKTILGQEAYREAGSGKGPRYDYFFYEFYKKCAGIPKIVVLGVDYFIYQVDSHKEWLARMGQTREIRGLLSSPSLLLAGRKDIEDFLNAVILRAGRILGAKSLALPAPDFVKDQEFIGIDPNPGGLITERPASFKRQRYTRFPGKEGAYLKRLLDEWRKDGVTVLMVIIPDYAGSYVTNIGQLRAMADLKRLTRDYPNVRIYDFNRPRMFPLGNVEYFRDGGYGKANSHLSRAGAEAFNRILLERIRPWYSGGPPEKPTP